MPSQYGPISVNVNTGALEYASGSIDSTSITDGSIATADLADGAVTNAKVNAAAAIAASKLTGVPTSATLTTKGDLYAASAASTPARLAAGSNGQVLVPASGQTTGLAWANGPRMTKHVLRTSGNFTLNNTSWTDLDTGTDLTLPAATGDIIMVGMSSVWGSNAILGLLDVATIVSASPVTYFSNGTGTPATDGIVGWSGTASVTRPFSGWAMLTLVSGDISSGTVTLRLRYKTATAGNKSLLSDTNDVLQFSARNLGPSA